MDTSSAFIIAEAGLNHNGDIARACAMVEAAAAAGADAVKFQTFKAERLVTALAPKAEYQARNTGSEGGQFEMLKALELSERDHDVLLGACEDAGIEFMSTPFDAESARFLADKAGVKRLKVASGEITNAPLLLEMARCGKPIILSTGMSTLEDIEAALGVLAFGYSGGDENPVVEDFAAAYNSAAGRSALKANVTLLHCTSEYPAPPETINLQAMATLADVFGLPVGLSDHSAGIAVAVAAAARGAVTIEKHFTLDKSLPGPDHQASLTPAELRDLVDAVRMVGLALGSPDKRPGEAELKTRVAARKSLVALKPIAKGDVFNTTNLGVKRPGGGISPIAYWSYLGKPAARAYAADELIETQ